MTVLDQLEKLVYGHINITGEIPKYLIMSENTHYLLHGETECMRKYTLEKEMKIVMGLIVIKTDKISGMFVA